MAINFASSGHLLQAHLCKVLYCELWKMLNLERACAVTATSWMLRWLDNEILLIKYVIVYVLIQKTFDHNSGLKMTTHKNYILVPFALFPNSIYPWYVMSSPFFMQHYSSVSFEHFCILLCIKRCADCHVKTYSKCRPSTVFFRTPRNFCVVCKLNDKYRWDNVLSCGFQMIINAHIIGGLLRIKKLQNVCTSNRISGWRGEVVNHCYTLFMCLRSTSYDIFSASSCWQFCKKFLLCTCHSRNITHYYTAPQPGFVYNSYFYVCVITSEFLLQVL